MAQTIVGLYDHISQARATIQDLVESGYEREDINFVANAAAEEYGRYFDEQGSYRTDVDDHELTSGEGAAAGAGVGATLGGLGGLLMGLGLLAIPGVGPALAAGPIVSALVGAGIGAAAGGLMGALVNHGVPEDEAGYYSEGVRRGGSLVMLTVDEAQVDEVETIMNNHHPVDIEERSRDWRNLGFDRYEPEAEPYTSEQIARERESYSNAPTRRDMSTRYRDHFNTTYHDQGLAYGAYEPAYLFGYGLVSDPAFAGMGWDATETEAERRWTERGEGSWTDYRDAVRYGYEQGLPEDYNA